MASAGAHTYSGGLGELCTREVQRAEPLVRRSGSHGDLRTTFIFLLYYFRVQSANVVVF